MKLMLSLLLLAFAVRADNVEIVSPDTAQTYSFSRIAHKELIWDEDKNMLTAVITFTNVPYADKDQPKVEEFFSFKFPGVTYHKKSRTFFALNEDKKKVPVAVWKEGLISDWIEPVEKAQIFVLKRSGKVEVILAATTEKLRDDSGPRWVERSEGWSLQNLLFSRD